MALAALVAVLVSLIYLKSFMEYQSHPGECRDP